MVNYAHLTKMLDGLFGLKISKGAIANMLSRALEPFAKCAEEIAETVRNSPVIASDETSPPRQGSGALAVDIRRDNGSLDHTDARQDCADRVPRQG
jgi:hypothetical protein